VAPFALHKVKQVQLIYSQCKLLLQVLKRKFRENKAVSFVFDNGLKKPMSTLLSVFYLAGGMGLDPRALPKNGFALPRIPFFALYTMRLPSENRFSSLPAGDRFPVLEEKTLIIIHLNRRKNV
jgi:hypothetical protein